MENYGRIPNRVNEVMVGFAHEVVTVKQSRLIFCISHFTLQFPFIFPSLFIQMEQVMQTLIKDYSQSKKFLRLLCQRFCHREAAVLQGKQEEDI